MFLLNGPEVIKTLLVIFQKLSQLLKLGVPGVLDLAIMPTFESHCGVCGSGNREAVEFK